MTKYMYQLKISGYDQKFRVQLLRGILNSQLRIDKQVREGTQKLYRSRQDILEQKISKVRKHPSP